MICPNCKKEMDITILASLPPIREYRCPNCGKTIRDETRADNSPRLTIDNHKLMEWSDLIRQYENVANQLKNEILKRQKAELMVPLVFLFSYLLGGFVVFCILSL